MRLTILARPHSDPGPACARGWPVVAVDDSHEVAAAALASTAEFVLLLARGARASAQAFAGLSATLDARTGVLGGATLSGVTRHFGWMLAPGGAPLPFELVPITAPAGSAGIDALVRGGVDVVAPGMLIAARELLLELLPADPVAALVELCARARDAGRSVVCRPAFACEAAALDADDRGRAIALRAVAEARPNLRGMHRLPPGLRRTTIEREVRAEGGYRSRARLPSRPLTIVVHGAGAAAAAAGSIRKRRGTGSASDSLQFEGFGSGNPCCSSRSSTTPSSPTTRTWTSRCVWPAQAGVLRAIRPRWRGTRAH